MKNNNKKGFTLTELLATIVILAVITTIATPAIIGISNSIKENMYKSKVKLILRAAQLYGEDKDVVASGTKIKVAELLPNNYLTCDDKVANEICIENPKNNKSMKECTIELKNNNGRVTAKWISEDEACQ